ncbi:acyltransferase domain-containing protein [Kitasatospora aureofaciens]|uniref:type I polyketide synthase n=1 Tax=Kitasatospora aureofaciens TaxID=1894 RepID=UPI001C44AC5C|nr:type I polyketide synthase [Kitasatospora aureofaciens]MBV6699873.1 acyltransferase domain-containing protein [Kitasatospora aureofaciens]
MEELDSAVAVVGVALRVPGAADPDTFWENLLTEQVSLPGELPDGTLGVGHFDRVADFDAELFGLTPTQAEVTDPQHRVATELVWQALEDAGIDTERDPGRVGVFLGCGDNAYRYQYVETDDRLRRAAGRQQISLGNDKDFLATGIAYRLGLTGPSLTVQTACSTSLVAVHLAVRSLLTYECDIAVAGGVTVQLPLDANYTYSEGDIVSPDGRCRPFTQGSRGTVPAGGAGVVVLRRAAEAGGAVRALVVGSAVNNDGADRMSLAAPSPRGQAAVIREALEVAGLEAGDIGFVETHGTGTELGDRVELSALAETYGEAGDSCALGSVKANIGHTDTAAGVIGLIKAVLAVQHGDIPPTPAQPGDGPDVELGAERFHLPRKTVSWPGGGVRRAAVSSFGLGGTNAHVVLAQPPAPAALDSAALESSEQHRPGLAVLSAAHPEALARTARSLAERLDKAQPPITELLGTLWHGRRQLPYRWAVPVEGLDDSVARRELATALRGAEQSRAAVTNPRIAVLLPGQGVPMPGAGRELARADSDFAADLAALQGEVRRVGGPDLQGSADWSADDPRLLDTSVVQPLLFTLELALLRSLDRQGIRPSVLLGHSVGELVAATWAEVFTVADGAAAVIERGRLMSLAAAGAMTALRAGEAAALELADGLALDVCAVNAHDTVVLGGDEPEVAELERRCAGRGIRVVRLATAHAFHSRTMAEAADAFADFLGTLPLKAPRVTVLSNLTGQPLTAEQATSAAYWGRQLGSTVRFGDAVDALLELDPQVVLEAGPGRAFTGQLRRAARAAGRTPVVAELLGDGRRAESVVHLAALGAAWTLGCGITPPVAAPSGAVRLPGYSFADTRYWAGPAVAGEPVPQVVREPEPETADGGTVAILAELWQESFGGPAIRPEDNFFELGGTSLQAAQLLNVVSDRLLVDLRLQEIYEHSSFADFAARVEDLIADRDDSELMRLLAELEAADGTQEQNS